MNLYEVQLKWKNGKWDRYLVFQFEPQHLSRFLDYLFDRYSCETEEERAEFRVKRIPAEYGVAQFEYRGEDKHYKVEH